MKKCFIYVAAALALTGCSNEEFLGVNNNSQETAENAILFDSETKAITRAIKDGADAAELLDNNFVVEGVKGEGDFSVYSASNEVFDHYNVNWASSTANTTESNTKDWEYVAQSQNIKGTSSQLSLSSQQTIKYWDYATSQYDFVAVSLGKGTGATPATYATLSKINYKNIGKAVTTDGSDAVYTLTGTTDELAAAYIADLVTSYKADDNYKSVVTPNFRKLGTKVRIAFYETVPGYAVSNVKFYTAAWDESTATSAAGVATPTVFAASTIFPTSTTKGTMSVYFPTVGSTNKTDADYNQAHINFAAGSGTGEALATTKTFGTALTYTAGQESAEKCTDILGRTSSTATYAGTGYETVLPLGTSDNMQIRIEYDLYPIDGGGEVIHVRDARAVVPKQYCDWKPNYAYTYIFKISDNTNGWTGVDKNGAVVEGLTPITFDAVVTETEDGVQETITTVSTPSITTYQEGKVITTNNEYTAGDIYTSVMNGTSAVTLTSSNACVYQITEATGVTATEKLFQDQLNGTKSNTGITIDGVPTVSYETEIPTADGNKISVSAAKYTVESGKTYAFVYTVSSTEHYVKIIRVQ